MEFSWRWVHVVIVFCNAGGRDDELAEQRTDQSDDEDSQALHKFGPYRHTAAGSNVGSPSDQPVQAGKNTSQVVGPG